MAPGELPALPGVHSSLGHSPPRPWPFRVPPPPFASRRGPLRPPRDPRPEHPRFRRDAAAPPHRPPLRYFRDVPFRVRSPVLQSFKEPGNRLASFEAAGPSEVSLLVPRVPRLPGSPGGCRSGRPTPFPSPVSSLTRAETRVNPPRIDLLESPVMSGSCQDTGIPAGFLDRFSTGGRDAAWKAGRPRTVRGQAFRMGRTLPTACIPAYALHFPPIRVPERIAGGPERGGQGARKVL